MQIVEIDGPRSMQGLRATFTSCSVPPVRLSAGGVGVASVALGELFDSYKSSMRLACRESRLVTSSLGQASLASRITVHRSYVVPKDAAALMIRSV